MVYCVPRCASLKTENMTRSGGREIKKNKIRFMGRKWKRRAAVRAKQMENRTRGRGGKQKKLHQSFKVSVSGAEQAFIACDSTLRFIFTSTAGVHVGFSIISGLLTAQHSFGTYIRWHIEAGDVPV